MYSFNSELQIYLFGNDCFRSEVNLELGIKEETQALEKIVNLAIELEMLPRCESTLILNTPGLYLNIPNPSVICFSSKLKDKEDVLECSKLITPFIRSERVNMSFDKYIDFLRKKGIGLNKKMYLIAELNETAKDSKHVILKRSVNFEKIDDYDQLDINVRNLTTRIVNLADFKGGKFLHNVTLTLYLTCVHPNIFEIYYEDKELVSPLRLNISENIKLFRDKVCFLKAKLLEQKKTGNERYVSRDEIKRKESIAIERLNECAIKRQEIDDLINEEIATHAKNVEKNKLLILIVCECFMSLSLFILYSTLLNLFLYTIFNFDIIFCLFGIGIANHLPFTFFSTIFLALISFIINFNL